MGDGKSQLASSSSVFCIGSSVEPKRFSLAHVTMDNGLGQQVRRECNVNFGSPPLYQPSRITVFVDFVECSHELLSSNNIRLDRHVGVSGD